MNKEKALSKELERSMNLQCNIMTFEEVLRNSAAIDKLDDVRRKKLYSVLSWNKDMQKHFHSLLTKFLKKLSPELKNELTNILNEYKIFQEKLDISLAKLKRDDFYYEDADDKNRNFLIYFAAGCREQLREANSEVETKFMLENIEKRAREKV